MLIKAFIEKYFEGSTDKFIETQAARKNPPTHETIKLWTLQSRQVVVKDGGYYTKWTTNSGGTQYRKLLPMNNEALAACPIAKETSRYMESKRKKTKDKVPKPTQETPRADEVLSACAGGMDLQDYIDKYYAGINYRFAKQQTNTKGNELHKATVGSWLKDNRQVISDGGDLFLSWKRFSTGHEERRPLNLPYPMSVKTKYFEPPSYDHTLSLKDYISANYSGSVERFAKAQKTKAHVVKQWITDGCTVEISNSGHRIQVIKHIDLELPINT